LINGLQMILIYLLSYLSPCFGPPPQFYMLELTSS